MDDLFHGNKSLALPSTQYLWFFEQLQKCQSPHFIYTQLNDLKKHIDGDILMFFLWHILIHMAN